MNNILMYCHNGSGNHGCEAIIRSTVNILKSHGAWQYYQISRGPDEDKKYGVDRIVKLLPEFSTVERRGVAFWRAYLAGKLKNDSVPMDILSNIPAFRAPNGPTVSLSIGGDNYCYSGYGLYTRYHKLSLNEGHKTVLWGCSVEPDALEDEALLADLRSFHKILVRESISYDAMLAKGLTNVVIYPDPAFTLIPCADPELVPPENTVGINCSPMVLGYGSENSKILDNYENLIKYILNNTDMNIALVPHVVWDGNDDRIVLAELASRFPDCDRIFTVPDMDCTKLKAYISRLRFFVGARTHATIAAYSTGVPTLVAGYSVKSRGIARDIFGTEENYVVSVKKMTREDEMTEAFSWIVRHETEIRSHLTAFIPDYIARAYAAGREITALLPAQSQVQSGIDTKQCTGCSACAVACPQKCLTMQSDSEGFVYPIVDAGNCIKCGLCTSVCPLNKQKDTPSKPVCYAVKNTDDNTRERSSSGGVFTSLAEHILAQGGVVFGAALDDMQTVRHIAVTDREKLRRLNGAKYSQSVIGDTYIQAKKALQDGKKVLFSGTPCQVAGLRGYLKKDYDNLHCVDLICHSVPSPMVWERYMMQKKNAIPMEVNFRAKDTGWSRYSYSLRFTYDDGTVVSEKNGESAFLRGMVQNLYSRPSCADCRFRGTQHPGDITLGDFWGIWDIAPEFDDNKGVSAVIVNTEKGSSLLSDCGRALTPISVTLDSIRKYNPSYDTSSHMHKNRDLFFAELMKTENIEQLIGEMTEEPKYRAGLIDRLSAIKHKLLRR